MERGVCTVVQQARAADLAWPIVLKHCALRAKACIFSAFSFMYAPNSISDVMFDSPVENIMRVLCSPVITCDPHCRPSVSVGLSGLSRYQLEGFSISVCTDRLCSHNLVLHLE